MADFSHLTKLASDGRRTVEYVIHEIDASLMVLPATESNSRYYQALLRSQRASVRRLVGGRMSQAAVAQNRAVDRELFKAHIVKGFGSKPPRDVNDERTENTPENVAAFIDAMPVWMFDDLRAFCGVETNFIPEDEPTDEDAEHQGNGSRPTSTSV